MSGCRTIMAAAIAALLAGAMTGESAAQDAKSDFFRGRTLKLVLPSGPGGGLDVDARLFSLFVPRHLEGHPTILVEPRPGGGGTVGAAYVYNVAPRDGSVLGILLPTSLLDPLLRTPRFDAKAFQWLGSFGDSAAIVSVWSAAGVRTIDDAKKGEVILGATGVGSNMYMIPVLSNHLFGTKFKVVTGYKSGTDINQAIERGEIQGRAAAWNAFALTKPDWLKQNKLAHLMQVGKIPGLDHVPSMLTLARTEEEKQMVAVLAVASDAGNAFYYPPAVPKALVDAMRKATDATAKDPAFIAEMAKMGQDIDAMTGEYLQKMVTDVFNTPQPVLDKMKRIFFGPDAGKR